MVDVALLFILFTGFMIGLKRGFILQFIHMTGFIIAFIVAYMNYEKLVPTLKLWIPYPTFGDPETVKMLFESAHLDEAYYRAMAFAILFFATKIVMQIIGSMLDFVAQLPLLRSMNRWAGGALGFVEVYLLLFLVLYVGALIPVEAVQTKLQHSFMASFIVKHTPFFSDMLKQMWIRYMA
ncbi:putative membrane protein required for colicin V production [Anoxybacillus voinovskiensis]|uniref:Putative membrane protein required for colicin V production n=1 Tax=Anoxybacteroides voinovskiense TaxID=230470 RepID=A0A840DN96_9BACL|nr:CvpA family protein [Anoxybacillus voinovskiensis]MBB4073143.1 putative membrane protein required for colicin V production [Anoxybacillus voinovskiensis]GGJ70634.1 membrane protein [Anoxybacillus voinovskiensis]